MGKNKELQTRREFFKKASKKTLPFLGAVVLGPAISLTTLTSCGCDGCEAACMDNCEGGCVGSCQGSATSSTCSDCSSSCSGSSTNAPCSNCANSCSGTCNNTCTNSAAVSQDEISPATGNLGGYEYVDLGLSVKWARYNIGASKPEGYGTYQLWGDIGGGNQFDPWPSLRNGGNISGTSYDNAVTKWGSDWRMPTKSQFQELIDNCVISEFTLNNHLGVKFTSKKNGNSIFLPLAGSIDWSSGSWKDWKIYTFGCYWSSEVKSVGNTYRSAYYLGLTTKEGIGYANISASEIFDYKYSIRPVTTKSGGGGGCTGSSCSSNCANNSTSSGCTGCSTGCSSSCKTTCEGSCINGCNTLCGGQCRYSCGGTCSYVSAGSSCTSSTCARTCSSYCYTTCTLACSSSCQSQCIYGSK